MIFFQCWLGDTKWSVVWARCSSAFLWDGDTTIIVSRSPVRSQTTVAFLTTEHHCPLPGTKLYCLVTEATSSSTSRSGAQPNRGHHTCLHQIRPPTLKSDKCQSTVKKCGKHWRVQVSDMQAHTHTHTHTQPSHNDQYNSKLSLIYNHSAKRNTNLKTPPRLFVGPVQETIVCEGRL